MSDIVTFGAVKYLNTRPLIYGLDREPGVRLRLERPSDLAPLLARGEVDAALIPAIEYFRLVASPGERARVHHVPAAGSEAVRAAPTHFVVLPTGIIGSRGAIGSIRLFGYVDQTRLRRVLLDPASRTSNALARLIVKRRFGVEPHFVLPEEIGASPSRPPDAELLIGDAGLVAERPKAEWIADLGLEWHKFTYLPFVYALWVARADGPIARLTELLSAARDRGLEGREAIADAAASELGVSTEITRRYLTEQVRYTFGSKEKEGLRLFYRMAAEEGLAPESARLRFPAAPDAMA